MESILPNTNVSKVIGVDNQSLNETIAQPAIDTVSQQETTFRFMVFYRWLALGAALLLTLFIPNSRVITSPLVIVIVTVIYTAQQDLMWLTRAKGVIRHKLLDIT